MLDQKYILSCNILLLYPCHTNEISSNCIYYNFYLERAYCALDKFFELKKFIRKPLMHRVLKIELDIQCLHKTVCIISSEWLLIEHAAKGLQDLMKLMVAIT